MFEFTNQYGEWLRLIVDTEAETAELSSCDFDTVMTENDRIQTAGLILSDEEFQWLVGLWRDTFCREMERPPFTKAMDAVQQFRREHGEGGQSG